MTFVDNQKGGLNLNANGESDSTVIETEDIAIYGEGQDLAEDCPKNHHCYCKEKMGMMLFGGHRGGRALHP
jgi:hypothetical protein